jgi:hypothetical protein
MVSWLLGAQPHIYCRRDSRLRERLSSRAYPPSTEVLSLHGAHLPAAFVAAAVMGYQSRRTQGNRVILRASWKNWTTDPHKSIGSPSGDGEIINNDPY